jgi:hypothetical protein
MVDGFFFNNGEGRSGWVGSVNINVCPNLKSFLVLRIPKKNPIKNKDINHYLFFIFQDYALMSFQLQPHRSPQPFWDAPLVGQVSGREMARDQRGPYDASRPGQVALVRLTYDFMIPPYDSHARSPCVVSLLD